MTGVLNRYFFRRGAKIKKKVFLINPPFYRLMGSHYNGLSLGLSYIASMLRRDGHDARIYNADYLNSKFYLDQKELLKGYDQYKQILNNLEAPIWHEIKREIARFAPDYIGIQMYTATYKSARNIAYMAKEINQDIRVIVGGTHPTIDPVSTLKSGEYDCVIMGEGEYKFLDLVNGRNADQIPGIVYRDKSGEIMVNEEDGFIENLDLLPFPDRDSFINDTESMDLGAIITSRGCPFQCTYCVSSKIWKREVRYRSVGNILKELEYMKKYYKVELVRFQDDIFTLDRQRVKAICNGIIERGIEIQWICDTRVDQLDIELLSIMKKAGCIRVKVGVESGSDEILKRVKKRITKGKILTAVAAIKEAGIPLTIYAMVGFPGETNDDLRATIKFVKEINADYNSLSIVAPYYGTEMYEELEREGFVFDRDHWEYFFHQSKDMLLNTDLDPLLIKSFFALTDSGRRV